MDASVAVKWVVKEADSEAALALLSGGVALLAPAHWLAEASTVLWARAVVHKAITREQAEARIARLGGLAVEETPLPALVEAAARLAFDLRLTVYDTLYLALAARRGVVAVTADRKLFDGAKRDEAASRLVLWVADLPGALSG